MREQPTAGRLRRPVDWRPGADHPYAAAAIDEGIANGTRRIVARQEHFRRDVRIPELHPAGAPTGIDQCESGVVRKPARALFCPAGAAGDQV